jgi:hypothetical protein
MSGRRPKTWVMWAIEALVLPLLPIALAAIFRSLSTKPDEQLLLWSFEVPFATLFLAVSSLYRLEEFLRPAGAPSERIDAARVGCWVLVAVSIAILCLFYADREQLFPSNLPPRTRWLLTAASSVACAIAAIAALVVEAFDRRRQGTAEGPGQVPVGR